MIPNGKLRILTASDPDPYPDSVSCADDNASDEVGDECFVEGEPEKKPRRRYYNRKEK